MKVKLGDKLVLVGEYENVTVSVPLHISELEMIRREGKQKEFEMALRDLAEGFRWEQVDSFL